MSLRTCLLVLLFVSCKRTPAKYFVDDDGVVHPPYAVVACAVDSDCVVIARGCCFETAVNRAHVEEAREGMPDERCSVKGACGPRDDGTWEGVPGVCQAGVCRFARR